MHYKDGTPALLGDIVQHDSGSVGIVIGGMIGNDYCSTEVLKFSLVPPTGGPCYVGVLRDEKGALQKSAVINVSYEPYMQTRECLKIGHMDIGHG